MKRVAYNEEKMNLQGFDILSENEMLEVRGGIKPRPKSRDIDILDIPNEE